MNQPGNDQGNRFLLKITELQCPFFYMATITDFHPNRGEESKRNLLAVTNRLRKANHSRTLIGVVNKCTPSKEHENNA